MFDDLAGKNMICLLCYESNDECISIDGEQGRQLKVSVLLYKYFRFCFNVSNEQFYCGTGVCTGACYIFRYVCSMNRLKVNYALNAGTKRCHFMNFIYKFSPFMKWSANQKMHSRFLKTPSKWNSLSQIWNAIEPPVIAGQFIVRRCIVIVMNCLHTDHWVNCQLADKEFPYYLIEPNKIHCSPQTFFRRTHYSWTHQRKNRKKSK